MTTSLTKDTQVETAPVVGIAVSIRQAGKKYPAIRGLNKNVPVGIGDFWALKDVSFDIHAGEVLGIIGRNGSGKTTLLNLIAGGLSSSCGEVLVKGRVMGLFNLGAGFQDELTGRENVFLNGAILKAGKKEIEGHLSAIIEFSELGRFIDMPIGSYSQGMRLRLAFSIIVNLNFDILALDEILSVGDILFQHKCFERLMDSKRRGKTMVVTTQSMEMIERFCDKAALLDHGRMVFLGDTIEAINKYRCLLNTEKFFVGPKQEDTALVENTKKWADDLSLWGQKLGSMEIVIDSVEFINRFGMISDRINSAQPLKVRVGFTAKNTVRNVHFGVAVFRKDGAYCYGPNTSFDEHNIPEIKPGKGWFSLEYKEVLLAPGQYNISVAIWDKNETVAYAYHIGSYNLFIKGNYGKGCLLNLPFKAIPSCGMFGLFHNTLKTEDIAASIAAAMNNGFPADTVSVKLLDSSLNEKALYITNEPARLIVSLNKEIIKRDEYILLYVFREDDILCQEMFGQPNAQGRLEFLFPKLPLLPGGYKVSLWIWNKKLNKLTACQGSIYRFQMAFPRQDHGTVYLEHRWMWSLP